MDSAAPMVVLMCGIAGSGKTTYAKELEAQGFTRLSIDEEVWTRFGRFGIDYDASKYPAHSVVAERVVREHLISLIGQGRDVVLDLSFWQRARRDRYKRIIEDTGAHWRLVYLKVRSAELRRRLAARTERFDANAAFPITADRLASYLAAFEEPDGEGEEVVTPRLQTHSIRPRRPSCG